MVAQPLNQSPHQDYFKKFDALSTWLFIAAVVHAIVLIGVSFDNPNPKVINKVIEVTLVNSATKKAPKDAKYFAQNNQIAAGSDNQKPLPLAKKKAHSGHDSQKQKQKKSKSQLLIEHRLITQQKAQRKLASAEQQEGEDVSADSRKSTPELSMEEIDEQIALLEMKLQQQKEASGKTRILSFNAISAQQYVAAQYIKDWEISVERNGNLNYPEINGTKDFSGTLTINVGINPDGSIYDIKVIKSSGNPALDAAAKQIVKDNAPFAPLPASITQQFDILEIRREFGFSDDGILSTVVDEKTQ